MLTTMMVVLTTHALVVAEEAAEPAKSFLGDTASWAIIASLLTPALISVIQRPGWTKRTRSLVAAAASIVVGVVTCLANGTLSTITSDPQNVLATVVLVLVASQAAYATLYKNTGLAAKIENATSPGTPKMPDPSTQPGYVAEGKVEGAPDVQQEAADEVQAVAAEATEPPIEDVGSQDAPKPPPVP